MIVALPVLLLSVALVSRSLLDRPGSVTLTTEGPSALPPAGAPVQKTSRADVSPSATAKAIAPRPSATTARVPTQRTTTQAPKLQITTTRATQRPATTTTTTTAKAAKAVSSYATQVVNLTNAERTKKGCDALTVNATLTEVAQAHSAEMAAKDYFSHDSPDGSSPFDRMTDAGYAYSAAGENIAAGQRTPADVVAGWMNSAGHRANILNCAFTQIGVGYATGGSYGTYWTQDFGTPR